MWIELAKSFTANCLVYSPATESQIASVEEASGVALPGSLRGLLSETNGLDIRPSFEEWDEPDECTGFIYSTEEIVETNSHLRLIWLDQEVEPLNSLLFFASELSGDFLGFPVASGRAEDLAIIRVSHEGFAERSLVAGSLQGLITTFLGHVQRLEAEAKST